MYFWKQLSSSRIHFTIYSPFFSILSEQRQSCRGRHFYISHDNPNLRYSWWGWILHQSLLTRWLAQILRLWNPTIFVYSCQSIVHLHEAGYLFHGGPIVPEIVTTSLQNASRSLWSDYAKPMAGSASIAGRPSQLSPASYEVQNRWGCRGCLPKIEDLPIVGSKECPACSRLLRSDESLRKHCIIKHKEICRKKRGLWGKFHASLCTLSFARITFPSFSGSLRSSLRFCVCGAFHERLGVIRPWRSWHNIIALHQPS